MSLCRGRHILPGLPRLRDARLGKSVAMISHFFIDRPIFATVLSIVITLTGGIALLSLPIAQYPQITPPAVSVSITYPGASAQVVADTVAAPIEQQVNGVEGMLYMSSQSGNDGSYTLTVTFDVGTDLNTALVMVQNRVMLAMPLVAHAGPEPRDHDPQADARHPDDHQSLQSGPPLRRPLPEQLRLDPPPRRSAARGRRFGLPSFSASATTAFAPGSIRRRWPPAASMPATWRPPSRARISTCPPGNSAQPPAAASQPLEIPIDALGRLSEPEQFGDIIVKVGPSTAVPMSTVASSPVQNSVAAVAQGSANPLQAAGSIERFDGPAYRRLDDSQRRHDGHCRPGQRHGQHGRRRSDHAGHDVRRRDQQRRRDDRRRRNDGSGAAADRRQRRHGGAGDDQQQHDAGPEQSSATATPAARPRVPARRPSLRPPRPAAGIVRLRDIARVEMGALNYTQAQTFDGHQSVGIAVFQLPGTNALDVADRVQAKMEELKTRFPEGVDYQIAYDTTPFIRESVADVVKTLFEAVVLVGLVVLVFLQNWRSVLIPMIAVPVAIVGTFAAMAVVGFSLNNISLFGLVLAIGIVVDDAIVVVENVDRWLEHGLPPREAARKAMTEVTGPIIAVALVLCAVFVPCAFISGITGRFFRQFAVTIAVSTVFSAINSLTLSPALAAILLRKQKDGRRTVAARLAADGWSCPATARVAGAGALLPRVQRRLRPDHGRLCLERGKAAARQRRGPVGLCGAAGVDLRGLPPGPQGLRPAAGPGPGHRQHPTPRRRLAAAHAGTCWPGSTRSPGNTPGVAHTITVAGYSFVQQANGSNFGSMFIVLDPFDKRTQPRAARHGDHGPPPPGMVASRSRTRRSSSSASPPVPGLSVAGGFKLIVEDRSGLGLPTLEQQTDALVGKLAKEPGLVGVSTQFRSNTPQLFMDIDRTKAAALGVSFNDVNQTLGIYLGSLYVNSFNAFGRHWQVTLQAEGEYRDQVSDINLLEVRNNQGQMVPLGTLVNVREIGGPIFVYRYNLHTAASITGNLRPGVSSGEVDRRRRRTGRRDAAAVDENRMDRVDVHADPRRATPRSYVFALAVMCVFLALAALYESWSLPLAVILVVPLCLLCSVAGVLATPRRRSTSSCRSAWWCWWGWPARTRS